MTTSSALSPTMLEALAAVGRRGGELVRRPGGYWTWPDCPPSRPGAEAPEWHASTGTVRALEARGLVEVVERLPRGDAKRVRLRTPPPGDADGRR